MRYPSSEHESLLIALLLIEFGSYIPLAACWPGDHKSLPETTGCVGGQGDVYMIHDYHGQGKDHGLSA